jgi:hypothetical protein
MAATENQISLYPFGSVMNIFSTSRQFMSALTGWLLLANARLAVLGGVGPHRGATHQHLLAENAETLNYEAFYLHPLPLLPAAA